MNIAILLCGHVRSWDKEAFLRTFQDVDVFVHTYNNVLGYHPFIENQTGVINNNQKLNNKELENYIGLKTKGFVVEDQEDIIIDDTNYPIHADTYAQYRKFKLCDELRTGYEGLNNMKYDLVIKTRFDISHSITIDRMVELAIIPNIIYISEGPSIYPCDQVFIGTGQAITFLRDMLTSLYYHKGEKFSPHEWLDNRSYSILRVMSELKTNIIRVIELKYKNINK